MDDIKMEKFSIYELDTRACLLILVLYDTEKVAFVSPLQIAQLFQVKLMFERPSEIHRHIQSVISHNSFPHEWITNRSFS